MDQLEPTREELIDELTALRRRASELGSTRSEGGLSGTLLNEVFATAPIGVYLVQHGRFKFVNEQFETFTGYGSDELVGSDSMGLVVAEDRERVRHSAGRMLKGETLAPYEFRVIDKAGETRSVMGTISPVSYQGERAGLGYYMDITERRLAEDALRKSEGRYRSLFENASDAITVKDGEGRYVMVNSEFARRLGRPKEDFVGRTPVDAYPADIGAKIGGDDAAALTTGNMVESEDAYETPAGAGVFLARKVPIRDEDGRTIGLIGISRDITERKRLEQRLIEQAEELRRSNKELGEFAHVASHDLQEPLRMVSSYVELLKRRYGGKLDADADQFIGFAVDGASRMQRLINDLLAYALVDAQDNPLEETDCHVPYENAVSNLKASIEESGATLTCDKLPRVKGDESQLVQLFQNLIGNALKFMRDARPAVHVGARLDAGEWVFSVSDNGIGIDQKYTERIFAIFRRLHHRDEYPGTGIGLPICQKIVERHGGRIWVTSEPGKGSTFFFTLPAIPD